jgi:hypothetical protein
LGRVRFFADRPAQTGWKTEPDKTAADKTASRQDSQFNQIDTPEWTTKNKSQDFTRGFR